MNADLLLLVKVSVAAWWRVRLLVRAQPVYRVKLLCNSPISCYTSKYFYG